MLHTVTGGWNSRITFGGDYGRMSLESLEVNVVKTDFKKVEDIVFDRSLYGVK